MSRRSTGAALLSTAICVLMVLATPVPAPAASANFCGTIVPSSNLWVEPGKYCSSYARTQWNYASNTYTGGGSITRMRAGLWSSGSGSLGHRFQDNATFVNSCTYGVFSNSFGVINQYEASGASHTLYGRVDDSQNNTNCFLYGV